MNYGHIHSFSIPCEHSVLTTALIFFLIEVTQVLRQTND
jgi:hypothetical protein